VCKIGLKQKQKIKDHKQCCNVYFVPSCLITMCNCCLSPSKKCLIFLISVQCYFVCYVLAWCLRLPGYCTACLRGRLLAPCRRSSLAPLRGCAARRWPGLGEMSLATCRRLFPTPELEFLVLVFRNSARSSGLISLLSNHLKLSRFSDIQLLRNVRDKM
jgi:hypothetical protein